MNEVAFYRKLFFFPILFNIISLSLTVIVVSDFGIDCELNPSMKVLFQTFGIPIGAIISIIYNISIYLAAFYGPQFFLSFENKWLRRFGLSVIGGVGWSLTILLFFDFWNDICWTERFYFHTTYLYNFVSYSMLNDFKIYVFVFTGLLFLLYSFHK